MNLLLYGVPERVAGRIAERYQLVRTSSPARVGIASHLVLVPPLENSRQLLALFNAMIAHEEEIDAVIVCGVESCEAAATVRCCSPQGKFFFLPGDLADGDLEYEITRIVETRLGRVCAHEGI